MEKWHAARWPATVTGVAAGGAAVGWSVEMDGLEWHRCHVKRYDGLTERPRPGSEWLMR